MRCLTFACFAANGPALPEWAHLLRSDRVTVVCFFASYGVALLLELWHLLRPRPVFRLAALAFGCAGVLAQTIYLYTQRPPLIWQFGWTLFLAWILAVFYVSGAIHHRRQAWGVFVLPVVLGLVALGVAFGRPPQGEAATHSGVVSLDKPWVVLHALLIFLAAVGMSVGFVASLMYLFQAHRLRSKAPPGTGLRLMSLERLDEMNRRAIVLAFPLLTAGILAGALMILRGGTDLVGWTDPRVLGTAVLWLAFAVVLFLRLAHHLRGRQVALLTIATFLMLICCIILSHQPLREGAAP
jgi:ABC-type transport system involved in cytochrome c biogenesis permease subunit